MAKPKARVRVSIRPMKGERLAKAKRVEAMRKKSRRHEKK